MQSTSCRIICINKNITLIYEFTVVITNPDLLWKYDASTWIVKIVLGSTDTSYKRICRQDLEDLSINLHEKLT